VLLLAYIMRRRTREQVKVRRAVLWRAVLLRPDVAVFRTIQVLLLPGTSSCMLVCVGV
jgi:hypothetical protein